MATAAGVAPTVTPTQANSQHSNTHSNASAGRSSGRATSNKSLDVGRKQSPVDMGTRRQANPKAWGSGTNPLTQRGPSSAQQNGSTSTAKGSNGFKMTSKEMGLSDKQAHERLAFVITAATGLKIVLTTKTGDTFEGLMAGSTLNAGNNKITLKMTKKLPSSATIQSNTMIGREASLIGSSPDHSMNFELRDITGIVIPEFTVPEPFSKAVNGTQSAFQTDTDISRNVNRGERTLQPWIPDGPDTTDFSLESSNAADWDQFAANKSMMAAKSTYDENLYTTSIDRSAPSYRKREAEAARIAREIENTVSLNPHLREERGQALEREDEDEEDKYSGVRRGQSSSSQLAPTGGDRYMPPARRPPAAQSTVSGIPIDSAIVSAQVSRTATPKSSSQARPEKAKAPAASGVEQETGQTKPPPQVAVTQPEPSPSPEASRDATAAEDKSSSAKTASTADSSSRKAPGTAGAEGGVAKEVLQQFKIFADAEKQKLAERKRAQANQDRTAKINELVRFSKTFKLKTPIPTDLVGILAKDPAKQEAIIEKAQREHEEAKTSTASPSASATAVSPTRKADASTTLAPVPDRQTFNRGRGGYPPATTRVDRTIPQQPLFPSKGASANLPSRPAATQFDRKGSQAHAIPAPIPILDGRNPASGGLVDPSGMTSPQGSTMHTPASVSSSSRFNVKASEFRPNAAAATFNPGAASNSPSSPASMQRTGSISRTASPSVFFGSRRPKPAAGRPSIDTVFNSIKRMKEEVISRLTADKSSAQDEATRDQKDYANNGGIPNAYQTGPRWSVREENAERTFIQVFDQPVVPVPSLVQSRSNSHQQVPYHHQSHHLQGSSSSIPQISTGQHVAPTGPHHYPGQYEEANHHRMHMPGGSPQVYPSPSISNRQVSAYASPMGNAAQLAYAQPSYFGGPVGQVSMQIRQFPGTPGMAHAQPGQMTAPMMAQQPSNGPYMAMPQQFNPQMSMYSPSPMHVYPQQNGYPSPGRMAPMMMQQGSQQGPHPGQPMMYSMSNQGSPMAYGQQGQMNMHRGSFAGQGYGSGPYQPHPLGQRAMSSGYGQHMHQKANVHHMHSNHGTHMNNQSPAYSQMDVGQEDDK